MVYAGGVRLWSSGDGGYNSNGRVMRLATCGITQNVLEKDW